MIPVRGCCETVAADLLASLSSPCADQRWQAGSAQHSVAIHPPYPPLRKVRFTLARDALANLARLEQNQPGGRGDGCNPFEAGAYTGPDPGRDGQLRRYRLRGCRMFPRGIAARRKAAAGPLDRTGELRRAPLRRRAPPPRHAPCNAVPPG